MPRKICLDDIPLDEAWRRFAGALALAGCWHPLDGEDLPLSEALGRVTAAPVRAAVSSPANDVGAMDGYAPRSEDTVVETEAAPVEPWTAVRPKGEDLVATELILPVNHPLRPVDLGAIAGEGKATVHVRRRPRVAVIPTGTELITVEEAQSRGGRSGDVIEYNSIVLAAQAEQWGAIATRSGIVGDYPRIRQAVLEAAETHDLVLISAGPAAGSEDFTSDVVEELGTLLVDGVAVRPGHSVILGMIRTSTGEVPLVGTPGCPVGATLIGELFVEPLLAKWSGTAGRDKPVLLVSITRKLQSSIGEDEWVRVRAGRVGDRVVAAPLSRGASDVTSLVRADGIVRIPRFSEGVDAGDSVVMELCAEPAEVDRTILHIGSHDPALDLLALHLAELDGAAEHARPDGSARRRLVSSAAGSVGGLTALRRGESHIAGSHLLDPVTGEYNVPYLKRYLPETPVVLMTLLRREQGLMVPKGNPKGVQSLSDLARDDVRFVNRQPGSGTRVLLDSSLECSGIQPAMVNGYGREEYTHLTVAAAVQSGSADCGLGVRTAASALGLDFVPVGWERYDLVIPREFYDCDLLGPLLELLRDGEDFRRAVADLEGCDPTPMGQIVAVTG